MYKETITTTYKYDDDNRLIEKKEEIVIADDIMDMHPFKFSLDDEDIDYN